MNMDVNLDCWYLILDEIKVKAFLSMTAKDLSEDTTIYNDFCWDKLGLLQQYYWDLYKALPSYTLLRQVVLKGSIECVELAIEKGCRQDQYICISAVVGGHLELLKWLRDPNTGDGVCPWDQSQYLCAYAADYGHLDILKWIIENGCSYDPWLVEIYAMKNNHTHIIEWHKSRNL